MVVPCALGVGCDKLGNIPLGGGWLAAAGASTGLNGENVLFFGGDCVDNDWVVLGERSGLLPPLVSAGEDAGAENCIELASFR